jgi:predicted RNA-binding protein YlxR (DUF448 family)
MKLIPKRTCIGCGEKKSKSQLVRLIVSQDRVLVAPIGERSGRGAYLCRKNARASQNCLGLAKEKNAFKKAFRKKVKSVNLGQKIGP